MAKARPKPLLAPVIIIVRPSKASDDNAFLHLRYHCLPKGYDLNSIMEGTNSKRRLDQDDTKKLGDDQENLEKRFKKLENRVEIIDRIVRKTAIWIYNFPTDIFPLDFFNAPVRATQIKKFFKQGMAVPQDMADGTSISCPKCYPNKKFGEKALPMVKIDFKTMEAM
uniref:Uncharacterized protein n=1 Tax=Romanomermis culicivorax TaxID=13658 RepID=A0A915KBX8_ROMCU